MLTLQLMLLLPEVSVAKHRMAMCTRCITTRANKPCVCRCCCACCWFPDDAVGAVRHCMGCGTNTASSTHNSNTAVRQAGRMPARRIAHVFAATPMLTKGLCSVQARMLYGLVLRVGVHAGGVAAVVDAPGDASCICCPEAWWSLLPLLQVNPGRLHADRCCGRVAIRP